MFEMVLLFVCAPLAGFGIVAIVHAWRLHARQSREEASERAAGSPAAADPRASLPARDGRTVQLVAPSAPARSLPVAKTQVVPELAGRTIYEPTPIAFQVDAAPEHDAEDAAQRFVRRSDES